MIRIVPFEPQHRDDVLALSIRAWGPVFPLLEEAVPRFVYNAFYPDGWSRRQLDDLAAVLDEEPENVDVAVDESGPVGWVCTRLHPDDNMGEVYVLAVDPEHHQQGIGRALVERSFARTRAAGMTMVMAETGDDPGHEGARRTYEALGFERWPVARYFADIT